MVGKKKRPRKVDPVNETPEVWKVYKVKWPNGDIDLVSARAGENLGDILEQVGDPADPKVEVTRYRGPLWISFGKNGHPLLEYSDHAEEMRDALGSEAILEDDDDETSPELERKNGRGPAAGEPEAKPPRRGED
jgi:hypothetical protein